MEISPALPPDRRSFLKRLLAAITLPLSAGCARVPSVVTANNQKLITVTFTVRGQIMQTNPVSGRLNYYFVVFNLTNDPNDAGPVPQISYPFSNGIATSDPNYPDAVGMVGFVQYGGGLTDVHLYRAPRDVTVTTSLAYKHASLTYYSEYLANNLGLLSTATVSGSTMSVTFDLNRLLLPAVAGVGSMTLPGYVQVNIILTDSVPSGSGDNTSTKFWDAMGDGRSNKNVYVTLSLEQTGLVLTASQAGTAAEPADVDVVDRTSSVGVQDDDTLDLTDWQIRIQ